MIVLQTSATNNTELL